MPKSEPDELLRVLREAIDASHMMPDEKAWPAVAMIDGPQEVVEVVVRVASEQSGIPMNWGYVGGSAVICSPGERASCLVAILRAIPRTNIDPVECFGDIFSAAKRQTDNPCTDQK